MDVDCVVYCIDCIGEFSEYGIIGCVEDLVVGFGDEIVEDFVIGG